MATAVTIPVKVGERSLNLVFKFGTIREAEAALGRPVTADLASGNIGFEMISALWWAVLQPSLMITREGADDLVDEAGVEAVTGWIAEGLTRYFGGDVSADSGNAVSTKAGKKGA